MGATLIGANAGELLAEMVLAMEMGATLTDIALTVHAHPTRSESTDFAAKRALGTLWAGSRLGQKGRRAGFRCGCESSSAIPRSGHSKPPFAALNLCGPDAGQRSRPLKLVDRQ